jgi:RNA polymerase sigma factor (sigma-70 family)
MGRTQPPRAVVSEELDWGSAPSFARVPDRPFDDFYRAEMPGLVALARGLCGGAVADDVAQEAMLAAYRRWPHVASLDWPEAWVRRTCANLAVSQVRRRLVEVRALTRVAERWTSPGSDRDAGAVDFWREVRRLPARQAQVVALHYLCDLSVDDVAKTLEIHPGTVKVHLSRARAELQRVLSVSAGWESS